MNILSINYNRTEEAKQSVSINIHANTEKPQQTDAATLFADSAVSGLGATTETLSAKQTSAGLTDEADDVLEQLRTSAQTAQGSLDALFKKLSGADCVKLDEEGFGLNDVNPEKLVTVVERIKIMLAAYCEDYQVTGGSIDVDDIKEVVGSTAMAQQVADKFSGYDIPVTDENVKEATDALNEARGIGRLSENTKNYLNQNHIEPTIDNLYHAAHQSGKDTASAPKKDTLTQEDWEQLVPQLENILRASGLAVDDRNLGNAKMLIEQDIPVTKETLTYKAELDALDTTALELPKEQNDLLDKIARSLSEGKAAKDTLLLETNQDWRNVAWAIETVNRADESTVMAVLDAGEELTIGALDAHYNTQGDWTQRIQEMSREELAAYRQLEEIRLLMTADAGMNLVRQGFSLDTAPIGELVETLKQIEQQMVRQQLSDNAADAQRGGNEAPNGLLYREAQIDAEGTEIGQDTFSLYYSVRLAHYEIRQAPEELLAVMLENAQEEKPVTLEVMAQTGHSLREQYRRAGRTYEAVGTEVRKDLGDSVEKAVQNSTSDILSELSLEDTKANRDAVRILGNNAIEITMENIDLIKEMYSNVKSLIENMNPQTVLSMIRDNVNPMTADIRDVNAYLQQLNQEVSSDEKYSKFLYKLDRTDGINAEERKKFIGIYRMLNIFEKDAGKAVGALLKQGADLTMANLIAAYNSRKAAGMDKKLDASAGMAEVSGTVSYYQNLFAADAQKLTPLTLKKTEHEKKIETRGIEEFYEAVENAYDSREESRYYEEYLKEARTAAAVDESIYRELARFDMEASISNIQAMSNLMQEGYAAGTVYHLLRETKKDTPKGTLLDETDSAEELDEVLTKLAEEADKAVGAAVERDEHYGSIEQLRMQNKAIHLISGMGRKHDYRIPFVKDGALGSIRLQLKEDKDNAGQIVIDAGQTAADKVHAELKIAGGQMSIFAVTGGDSAALQEKLEAAVKVITEDESFGIADVRLNTGTSDRLPNVDVRTTEGHFSTNGLYRIAKEIVKSVL